MEFDGRKVNTGVDELFRMAAAVSEIITSSTHITIFRVLLDIWPGKKADAYTEYDAQRK